MKRHTHKTLEPRWKGPHSVILISLWLLKWTGSGRGYTTPMLSLPGGDDPEAEVLSEETSRQTTTRDMGSRPCPIEMH